MKSDSLTGFLLAVCLCACAAAQGVTTNYVSMSGADDAAHTGKSWALAKRTIQAAVDLCGSGDVVMVDDGTYCETTDVAIQNSNHPEVTSIPTVVHITKPIKLVSRNGKERTHIVGAWADTESGLGVGAHRGIMNSAAAGTVIQGFTIRDCATVGTGTGHNDAICNGGAISSRAAACTVVDCTIDNCRAGQGGASDFTVDFYRCLITRCRATGRIQVFYRGSHAANCVIAACGDGVSSHSIMPNVQRMDIANCTFIRNSCAIATPNGDVSNYIYNCAVLDNQTAADSLAAGSSAAANFVPAFCVDSRTDGRIAAAGADAGCQGGVDACQYLSPGSGDWRMVAGGCLKDAGCNEYAELSWIPAAYRTDFFGRPRVVGGTVDIGAIEQQPDETDAVPALAFLRPASGVVLTAAGCAWPGGNGQFWYSSEAPVGQIRVAPQTPTTVFGYLVQQTKAFAHTLYRFPDCGTDGGFWYAPQTNGVTEISLIRATDETWVDAAYAGDDSDGTEAKPYPTIQAAFNATQTNGVVHVKPGVYATGVNSAAGLDTESSPDSATCRVSIWKDVAIRSTAGAAQTVIRGGSDVSTIVRASRRTRVSQIQGFTLTGQDGTAAGAFYAMPIDVDSKTVQSANLHLTDCVLSNNVSQWGAMVGGWAERCLFRDNFTTEENMNSGTSGNRGTHAYGSVLSACVLDYSPEYFSTENYPVACTCVAQNDYLLECSLQIPPNDRRNVSSARLRSFNTANGCTVACNNALVGGYLDDLAAGLAERVMGNLISPGSSRGNWLTGYEKDYYMADSDARDYRPVVGCAGLQAGAPTPSDFVRYEVGDFDGQSLDLQADGAPVPGAFQVPVKRLIVLGDARGTVSPSGVFDVDDGESLTVQAVPADAHALRGWVVNGVTNLTSDATYTYTVDASAPLYALTPIFSRDIYIDAVNGDDGNDACTPETARRTLASVSLSAVAGDTIHAAEGDYDRETVDWTPSYTTGIFVYDSQRPFPRCRGVVGSGVRLVATGSPSATFITGAFDPEGETCNGVHYANCGTNAVRGLIALAGSRVEGFTIRNGGTRGVIGGPTDINGGGCVLAPKWNAATGDASTATFVNCVISNGCARSGGCVLGGVYYKCRLSGGKSFSTAGGCASCGARHIQCLIDRADLGDTAVLAHYGVVNCTLYNNAGFGQSLELGRAGKVQECPIANSVICIFGSGSSYTLSNLVNCAIVHLGEAGKPTFDLESSRDLVFVDDWESMGVDWLTGAVSPGSPAIDAGDASVFRAESAEGSETDFAGGQRVYNDGKIDLGCREFDWRPVYAACLAPRHLTVDAADASVTTNAAGALVIPAGTVAATWRATTSAAKLPVEVTGTGTLTLSLNDAVVASVTADDGCRTVKLPVAASADNALVLSYAPGAGDTGAAVVGPLDYASGVFLILR
ncbi:MAG: choice-of-anchor Q domain-containing protein [Kiritimatiellia bacterium]